MILALNRLNVMNKTPNNEDPKDGFDLIDYPCDFNFKAMCRADSVMPAIDYMREIIEPLVSKNELLSMSTNSSRTGKFESVTAVVRIKDRNQLEMIYETISSADRVVMTL